VPITIKKVASGKLPMKGRDNILKCILTWDDDTHPDLSTSHFYLTLKSNDTLDDEDAEIAFNSEDNPDQFIIVNNSTGELNVWIKKADTEEIVADTVKYGGDIVVILSDGTEWPFMLDYNIVFSQPMTQVTGHTV